ncbi:MULTISPECIES: DUF1835 domain-containing protein [unclassified Paenibacillus]|uniref:DUF1835 domain-containing protein n=1 Tax=unclassified Paenibacillus TaxID=185978 RepID=UPI002783286F|nr:MULTISPECIES: DUF1835 domain-containing protein [unclassified Paenibacillus]MDQ0896801.1 hypothetical protein [Paenibacillus sp. V4I7]MDQ0917041.1 hypothetical protein [Paenibacillus sp. V4I5]
MKDKLEIKMAVDSFKDTDLMLYLRLALKQIRLLKEQEEGTDAELIELNDELMGDQEKKAFWDPDPGCTHVHIVVGESFAGGMKQALKGVGWTETHKLITMKENYTIGPLGNLDSTEGRKARSDWFHENITESFETYIQFEEEYNDLLYKLEQIPEQAEVIVWISRSVREQIGMRHAIHLLRNKRNIISVCDACATCEELYNRPDAFIEYRHSGEIPPDKLQEALIRMNGNNKLGTADMTLLAKEWLAISDQGGTLRNWQDGVVFSVSVDYYDQYLLEKLDDLKPPSGNNGFLISPRLIGEAIAYCEQDIGDSYFEYRLREMIYDGILEIKGIPEGMRFYSIRRKQRAEK